VEEKETHVNHRLLVLLIIFSALGLAGFPTVARAQQAYTIDYVITPYNASVLDSWFFGINDRGEATGYVVTRDAEGNEVQSPVIYRNGEMRLLASGNSGNLLYRNTGLAINNRGDVVATPDQVLGPPIFFAAEGEPATIVMPGVRSTTVRGLNDSGTVLVSGGRPAGAPTVSARFGLWSTSGLQILSVLDPLHPRVPPPAPGGPSSSASPQAVTGLNNANQFAAGVRQFISDPGDPDNPDDDVFTDRFLYAYVFNGQNQFSLLQAPAPGEEIVPIGIDQGGTVFGWAGERLALWGLDGSLTSLLPDPGVTLRREGFFGYPTAQRNDRGQVVAVTQAQGVVLFDPDTSAWTDITSSISGLGTGTFSTIQGFNNQGQFVGLAHPPGRSGVYAYVATPQQTAVPEPATCALLASGLLPLAGLVARRLWKRSWPERLTAVTAMPT
jgi:hypothetical protein